MPGGPRAHPLRETTCLAHSVPSVTLRLHCRTGAELLVSYSCLGADLDPCRLRATLLHERALGAPRLDAAIERVEIVAGLRPLGAGLYERHASGVDARWFVSALAPESIVTALTDGPDRFHTAIKPDPELGVHAVCVRPLAGAVGVTRGELDEAAVWAMSAVLAEELSTQLLGAATAAPLPHPIQPIQRPRKDTP